VAIIDPSGTYAHRDWSGLTMHLRRHADAVPYEAPFHANVDTRRMQGLEAGPSDAFWVGISQYPPGSSAGPSEVKAETVYVVLEGELTLDCEGAMSWAGTTRFASRRASTRTLVNESDADATLLVVIAK
jgi:uncharacterized cupin superfamily protein